MHRRTELLLSPCDTVVLPKHKASKLPRNHNKNDGALRHPGTNGRRIAEAVSQSTSPCWRRAISGREVAASAVSDASVGLVRQRNTVTRACRFGGIQHLPPYERLARSSAGRKW